VHRWDDTLLCGQHVFHLVDQLLVQSKQGTGDVTLLRSERWPQPSGGDARTRLRGQAVRQWPFFMRGAVTASS
jgi:hypothetical protein